jgi:hypothetical protein
MKATARLLDLAVNDTVRRWPMIVPFVVLGFIIELGQGSPQIDFIVVGIVGALLENRTRVIAVASLNAGKGIRWSAAVRYRTGLWLAFAELLSFAPLILASIALIIPYAIWKNGQLMFDGRWGIGLPASVIADVTAAILFAVTTLVVLAAFAALMDVVADQARWRPALGSWLWRCFRRRTLASTLLAGIVLQVLFVCGTGLSLLLPPRPYVVHALVFCVPDGIADTLAFFFVWHWRSWRIDIDHGRDISQGLLDGSNGAVSV